jgi:calcineurin-like phosphoesterase family protein
MRTSRITSTVEVEVSRMIWVTADQHFGHANIIKYCNRPFNSVEHMNRVLIDNWNACVDHKDLVYVLGDLCMSRTVMDRIIPELNGTIILVHGNHDLRANKLKQYTRIIRCCDETTVHDNHRDFDIYMVHNPMRASDTMNTLCGHVHDDWLYKYPGDVIKTVTKAKELEMPVVNVGVDVHNFKPITLESAIALLFAESF